jgi:hypothetical protein
MASLPYPCGACGTPLYNYTGACHNPDCNLHVLFRNRDPARGVANGRSSNATPEHFDALGDGVEDDTAAIKEYQDSFWGVNNAT